MKNQWQAARKTKSAFTEKNMTQIPKGHRYDPNREEARSQIGERTLSAYERMITAARKDGLGSDDLKIVASNRDKKRQEDLQKGVPADEIGFTVAAKHSVHFTGRALDLHVGGIPVDSNDENRLKQSQSRAYKWLVENGEKFGFRNYFYEPWHWEYIGEE